MQTELKRTEMTRQRVLNKQRTIALRWWLMLWRDTDPSVVVAAKLEKRALKSLETFAEDDSILGC